MKRLLALYFFFFIAAFFWADEWQSLDAFPYFSTHYTEDTGLPYNSLVLATQDKFGFMYFGTWGKGLFRFNGHDWTQFNVENAGLNANAMIDLLYDGGEIIYIAHMEKGVSVLNIVTGKSVPLVNPEVFTAQVTRLHLDGNFLYICSMKGLWIFALDTGDIKYYPCVEFRSINHDWQWQHIRAIFKDSRGRLWLGSRFGLLIFDRDPGKIRFFPFEPRRDVETFHIEETTDNNIIVFTKTFIGLVDFEDEVVRDYPAPELNEFAGKYHLPDHKAFIATEEGKFFLFSHGGGGLMYDPTTGKRFNLTMDNQFLIRNYIHSVFVDREKNIWVLTTGGISKIRPSSFRTVYSLGGYRFDNLDIYSAKLHQLRNSREESWLYFHEEKAAARLTAKSYFMIDLAPVIEKNDEVSHILTYRDQPVFRIFDESSLPHYHNLDGGIVSSEQISHFNYSPEFLVIGNKQYSFFGSSDRRYSVAIEDSKTGAKETVRIKLWNDNILPVDVFPCFPDKTREKILFIYNGEHDSSLLYNITTKQTIPNFFRESLLEKLNRRVHIKDIIKDGQGGFWISLIFPQGMIFHYSEGTWKDYSSRLGTTDVYIEDIKIDGQNRLLVATATEGLLIYDNGNILHYSRSEGMESNRQAGGIHVNAEGTVFIFSRTALSILNEENRQEPLFNLGFYVVENVNDRSRQFIFNSVNHKLETGWRNVTFYASANSYLYETELMYRFLIEGPDQSWSTPSKKNYIQLPQLKPGEYKIKVRAVDHLDRSVESGFIFQIASYWYETIIFRVLLIIAIIGFMIYIFRAGLKLYTRGLNKKALMLERKVEERTAELKKTQEQLVDSAHRTGKSIVAADILHNAGNILNSINVSTGESLEIINRFPLRQLKKANKLLNDHQDDLAQFLTTAGKGKMLIDYFQMLENSLESNTSVLVSELKRTISNILIMRGIILAQEEYTKVKIINSKNNLLNIIEETRRIITIRLEQQKVFFELVKDTPGDEIYVMGQKSILLHIFISLYGNAIESLRDTPPERRRVTTNITGPGKNVVIRIRYPGRGYTEEEMKDIFSFHTTLDSYREGYKLHSCANFVNQMNGSIRVESAGKKEGAEFVLSWPKG